MKNLKIIFLLLLAFVISSCELIAVRPDKDVVENLDPETAKSILKLSCPTCNDSTINLSCEEGYFVDESKTQTSIDYPYHNLVMICYGEEVNIKGRETDCISGSNPNSRRLPKVVLKAGEGKKLCNATFATINYYRKQHGIGAWGYYQQKAMPEQ